ncbi:interleukin-18 receptor 1 isoform X1 [Lates calcarifer]|uniref:Interleukin-18 receptor 1 isoform X1 n=2 Tax=Lates calcarifer TaxID=8187 RepID=A0A4W6CK92_LATCA|nr:interleukin-18 receptor 1 isoform X1 [Lates calcarifer]
MITPKILLLFLLTVFTGVCPREIHSKAGEMVALYCPRNRGYNHADTKLVWTSHTTQRTYVTNNMSSDELTQMGVVLHGRSLVILSVSINHQGNYSCAMGNASSQFWFRLTVNTAQSREHEEETKYSKTCYTAESCELFCPDENIPAVNTPNITSNGITWHKKGESWPIRSYFSRVEAKDSGVYTCTRSYLYHGQIYNMTFTVVLNVKTKEAVKTAEIISPHQDEVFPVDLGSAKVINCTAVVFSNFDGVFWLSGKTSVSQNTKSPVFYNLTREKHGDEIKITASLVFKKVSQEDLSKNYTCKLESVSQSSSFVTITLVQKTRPSYTALALSIVGIVVLIVVTVVIYVKLKIDITLFLRDTLGCHRSTSDGKSYDAFLMCYKSDTDAGLNAHDRKQLESVLEERFGYSLCLYDYDVLPREATVEAVLDRIEQCRTVVLVPTSPDPGLGSGVLSAIHAALVERQTHLIFIKTETTEASTSGSLAEALQLLSEAGDCVTWRGMRSIPSSSSFWKQLRYYLPVPQHAPKISLLPDS